MKMKCFCFAFAGVVPALWVGTTLASQGDEPAAAPQVVVLENTDEPGQVARNVIVEVRAENGEGEGDVVVHGGGGPVVVKVDSPADPNRGWLGVQLGEVPPSLAAHLPTAGSSGVLVANVVKESPADRAGLQQYDVITAVDGKSVTGVGRLSEIIGALKPESKVSIKVRREGGEQSLQVTLSSRPAGEDIEWKHEFAPDAEIHESFKTRGKILRRDKDGKIVIDDLGDLHMLGNLPEDIKAFIPNIDELTTKVTVDDENQSFSSVISRDGETITVKQDNGGEIEVKRTDKDGKTSEATYADAEALMAADEEAHEIYEQAQSGAMTESGAGKWKTFQFKLPGGQWNLQGHEQWREEIEKAMREARESVEGAKKSVEDAKKHFQFRFRNAPGHPLLWSTDENGAGGKLFWSTEGRSFRVNPEGQIEVTIRKGDSEVTKVFKDEADMAARDPELHQAYGEVLSDADEE